MSPLGITLLIIGIMIIVISCILIDKNSKNENQKGIIPFSFEDNISEEDKKRLLEKMQRLISEISEETILQTEDAVSKLSNEKIMAVNEFSEQILEKITRNHEEVVFLYNMLNDKEKELKAALKELDSSRRKMQVKTAGKESNEKNLITKSAKPSEKDKSFAQPVKEASIGSAEVPIRNSIHTNNNSQILDLFSQGKSVVEISKLLGLGQGEVKLVIELFKGKK